MRVQAEAEAEHGPARSTDSGLRACAVDQFRQFECERAPHLTASERAAGAVREVAIAECPSAPQRGGLGAGIPHPLPLWRPAVDLRLDGPLTVAYRADATRERRRRRHAPADWSSQGCCYSACVDVPVRAQAHSTHDYRSIVCVPEFENSQPSESHPRCARAIEFPDAWHHHVAAFDTAATGERTGRVESGAPITANVRWCCYADAPMAAIGPM